MTDMDIVEGLNPSQRAAVEHGDGPLLVVAGAGTGKTQVITRRIAYLIRERGVRPSQVLALTFTEKAAREMEERLYGLVGWESFQVPVMTFHAFGAELLSRFASHIGRSVRGGLINDVQKTLLLQQHLSRVDLGYYGPQADSFEFLEGIVRYIGELQNAGIDVARYRDYVAGLRLESRGMHPRDVDEQDDLAALYELYESIKLETGTFDYDDQLHVPLKILQQRPNLADRLARDYQYVLVDEYQDTNSIQDELLRTFVGPSGNIFAVGDDDQAIYGFRGADVGNILGFADHFALSKPVVLTQNYRSGQPILDSSYQLICHNDPERLEAKLSIDKRLRAVTEAGKCEFVAYKTTLDEQAGVLEFISARLRQGQSPHTIAVLAATHAPLKALAKAMRLKGIEFALSTAVAIFDQPELMGLWHLLKWLLWQADEQTISHVLMGPFIGWRSEDCAALVAKAHDGMVSIEEALGQDLDDRSRELMARLSQWREWARELPVSQLVFKLVFETGVAERWQKQAQAQVRMVRVFEDLQRLLNQMQDFETVALDTTVLGYSKVFPKPPVLEVSEAVGDEEGVQLLTVHAAKGLEFETVFLIGCSQRSWSAGRATTRRVPESLQTRPTFPPEHEFRRLMYVAATRAKQELIVSAAVATAGGLKQVVSPLVGELLGEAVDRAVPVSLVGGLAIDVMSRIQRFYPLASQTQAERLPFESIDGWFDLTVTELGRYEYCPFEFYVERVLGIKQPFGPQLAFGNILHKIFELYYKERLAGRAIDEKELGSMVDELWSDRGYDRRSVAEADRRLAKATVAAFVEREQRTERRIVASEFPVRFELGEARLRLRGKMDALFETAEGVELRDFKTGRTKTDADKLAREAKDNFQLRSYALAYELLNGKRPARVTLDYVVTGVEGSAELSATILNNHRVKLAGLAERIRGRDFAPNSSPMHDCAATRYYGTGEQEAVMDELFGEGAV